MRSERHRAAHTERGRKLQNRHDARLEGPARRGTIGKDMLAAPLVHYAFALDWTIVIGIVGLAYGLGLWSAARAGRPHPLAQVVAFYASLAILLVSFLTPVDAYDNVSFFDHMAQ